MYLDFPFICLFVCRLCACGLQMSVVEGALRQAMLNHTKALQNLGDLVRLLHIEH